MDDDTLAGTPPPPQPLVEAQGEKMTQTNNALTLALLDMELTVLRLEVATLRQAHAHQASGDARPPRVVVTRLAQYIVVEVPQYIVVEVPQVQLHRFNAGGKKQKELTGVQRQAIMEAFDFFDTDGFSSVPKS